MNIFDKVCGKMGLMDPEDEKEELEEYFEEDEKKPSFMKTDEGSKMDQHNEGNSNVVDFHSAASRYREVVQQYPDSDWATEAERALEDAVWLEKHASELPRNKR